MKSSKRLRGLEASVIGPNRSTPLKLQDEFLVEY